MGLFLLLIFIWPINNWAIKLRVGNSESISIFVLREISVAHFRRQ